MQTLTSRKKWVSIAKGGGIALAGALLAYIITVAGDLDWGPWTPLAGAILAVMTNIVRKFGLKDSQLQPVFTQIDLVADEVAGVQIGRHGHKLWVCIDGFCILRVQSPVIELTDDRDIKYQQTPGITAIATERDWQINEEGFGLDHDEQHTDGTLAIVAAALAVDGTGAHVYEDNFGSPNGLQGDAWGLVRKHRPDRLRQLAIAGALIAAEYDRELAKKGHPSA